MPGLPWDSSHADQCPLKVSRLLCVSKFKFKGKPGPENWPVPVQCPPWPRQGRGPQPGILFDPHVTPLLLRASLVPPAGLTGPLCTRSCASYGPQ